MVVTLRYRPSDVEAVKILNQIKAKLGISGKIDTPEERTKAYYYLKGKGWNMSMLACNPDYINDPQQEALCMLFNEMRGEEIRESMRGNESQLKKYGSAFKSTYEKNTRIFSTELRGVVSSYKNSSAEKLQEVEKNTGIKTVPSPKRVPTIIHPEKKIISTIESYKRFWLNPAPNPTVPKLEEAHIMNQKKENWKSWLWILGLLGVLLILRRR